jgi:acetyltransferase-like isoleucine patch superfamily enzyme
VSIGVRYDICGNNNRIIIGRGAILSKTRIFMKGDFHTLEIGENCRCEGGSFHFEDQGCIIHLGKSVILATAHLAVTEPGRRILIGNDCIFGNGLEIRTGDSHSIVDIATGKRINFAKDVTIGNHVWVGAHAKLLKGTVIGDGSIVGTGSIVSGRIGSNRIVSGAPAITLMSNVTWKTERIYKAETE